MSERPRRVRPWAPQGETPVLQYSFTWNQLSAVAGVAFCKFYFKLVKGAVRASEIVAFLKNLRRHLAPRKLLIIWDRRQAHRSHLVRDYVESEGGGIKLEFLPAYAPELNPPLATPLRACQETIALFTLFGLMERSYNSTCRENPRVGC